MTKCHGLFFHRVRLSPKKGKVIHMKKKILLLLCTLVLVFSQVACSRGDRGSETDVENVSTPYFWKVTGNGFEGEFYLLGSIHVGDEHTNLYPEEITKAFKKCDYLAVESDIVALESNLELQFKVTNLLMYPGGASITAHIDPKVYEEARKILTENGYYNQAMDMLQPIYWMSLIDNIYISKSDYSADYGVDRHFLLQAAEKKKTILEIEDPLETYKALVGLSPATQEFLLAHSVQSEYMTESLEGIKELYAAWKKGDMTGQEDLFEDASTEGMTEEEIRAYEEYSDMLLTTRNAAMVNTAVSYLESGKDVFYIVGLAHMFGDDGLVNSLIERGYTVTQVTYDLDQ